MGTKLIRSFAAVGMGVLLSLTAYGTALAQAQETQVSGTVTSVTGEKLAGVTVQVRGTDVRATTDANGRYSLTAPNDGVLLYNLIGYKGAARTIAGRETIDVALDAAVAVLDPVIVTGYTSQKRADITGAVGSVNMENAQQQTSVSVLQRLDGRVAGVQVENSGSPGARSTVRIRGVSSFQNNDPLYIVDGTPVQDTYLNWLNPDEVASIQVLKDASAASIYGSRASNGVVIVETKRGRPGQRQISLDVRTGVATPTRGYDKILELNALDYFDVVKTASLNGNLSVPTNIYGLDPNNPSVPAYIYPNNCRTIVGVDTIPTPCTSADVNEASYSYPNNLIMPGSGGTNWWKAVFGAGQYRDANLAFSGGGDDNAYHVSLNYLDQDGTAAFTRLQRGGARVNTTFNVGKMRIGENIAVSRERKYGGLDDDALGEDNIVGKNIFQQPVVPIYDIAGNFASGKANGLSNLTNPLKIAQSSKDNITTNDRIFGNVFAGLDAGRSLSFNTRFGFNLGQGSFHGFTAATPENSEVTAINAINENYNLFTEWTWSNTLNWTRVMQQHNLVVLLGQEANQSQNRFESGNCANLLNPGVDTRYINDALCDPNTKNVFSQGSKASLLSFFGKADYNYNERYYLSVTVRRDGSSRLGPENRWGTFPAVGLGWRLSREGFLDNSSVFSNVMLRFGWGVTGNQQIPPGRIVSQFGGDRGDTFYDIGGTGTTIRPGSKMTSIGNAALKWEEQHSTNLGLDLEFLQGRATFSGDVYNRNTENLLFDPRAPATAGSASPPIINIGKMKNTGFDLSMGFRGQMGAGTVWSATLNGSHYKNEIVQIDNLGTQSFTGPFSLREQNPTINMVGHPIGAFYGLVADGYYADSADAAAQWNSGARPGRIKFKDLDGDGAITSNDRTIIGDPHPDFTTGLDLTFRRGSWELAATIFGSFGGQIFNSQKYWYVFRYFDTNVVDDRIANSVVLNGRCSPEPVPVGAPPGTQPTWPCPGVVTNPDAKYPRLDAQDAFSRQFSSYWVEDGSYVRMRTLQLAYNLPPALIKWIPAARVYLQAENLFTISGYSGLDPTLPAAAATGAAGDIRDQFRGVDQGSYPSSRVITLGISTTF
jgi:TonB-linked SusC/RagA family outer membrane protein